MLEDFARLSLTLPSCNVIPLVQINAMPWQYASKEMDFGVLEINTETGKVHIASELVLLVIITFGTIFSLLVLFVRRERTLRDMYEPVKDVSISV